MSQAMDDRGWADPGDEPFAPLVPPQPAGSSITVERFADGLTIRVPPAGLWRGTRGLFAFSLLWNGMLFLFLLGLGCAGLTGEFKVGDENWWIFPLVLGIFGLVGMIILLVSINMGRRHAAFAVTGGRLMVLQTGIFGSKERSWAVEELAAIRLGPSGMEVNKVPVLQLQIFDRLRKKTGLLTGRPDDELEWLASELRAALEVSDDERRPPRRPPLKGV